MTSPTDRFSSRPRSGAGTSRPPCPARQGRSPRNGRIRKKASRGMQGAEDHVGRLPGPQQGHGVVVVQEDVGGRDHGRPAGGSSSRASGRCSPFRRSGPGRARHPRWEIRWRPRPRCAGPGPVPGQGPAMRPVVSGAGGKKSWDRGLSHGFGMLPIEVSFSNGGRIEVLLANLFRSVSIVAGFRELPEPGRKK